MVVQQSVQAKPVDGCGPRVDRRQCCEQVSDSERRWPTVVSIFVGLAFPPHLAMVSRDLPYVVRPRGLAMRRGETS